MTTLPRSKRGPCKRIVAAVCDVQRMAAGVCKDIPGRVHPWRHRFHWRGAGSRLATGMASSPFCRFRNQPARPAIRLLSVISEKAAANPEVVFPRWKQDRGADAVFAKAFGPSRFGWPMAWSIRYGPAGFRQAVLEAVLPQSVCSAAQRLTFLQDPAATLGAGVSTSGVQLSNQQCAARAVLPALRVQEQRWRTVAAMLCSTPSNCATSPSRPCKVLAQLGPS